MNDRIKELAQQAAQVANEATDAVNDDTGACRQVWDEVYDQKFAELIIEECRNVVTEVYHKTPLELCGPLLTADEEIAKHFYGVPE